MSKINAKDIRIAKDAIEKTLKARPESTVMLKHIAVAVDEAVGRQFFPDTDDYWVVLPARISVDWYGGARCAVNPYSKMPVPEMDNEPEMFGTMTERDYFGGFVS